MEKMYKENSVDPVVMQCLNGDKLVHDSEIPVLWVFGYGSILWKTGFDYDLCVTGYIQGFVRRFWQGNTHHRGTPDKPGRVATLVESPEGKVWGAAYKLVGEAMITDAMEHLGMRECTKGGYKIITSKFTPRNTNDDQLTVLAFYATVDNSFYLGDAPILDIAMQVVDSKGVCGENTEYVLRLAEYVKKYIPEDEDEHLFKLEFSVLHIMNNRQIATALSIDIHHR